MVANYGSGKHRNYFFRRLFLIASSNKTGRIHTPTIIPKTEKNKFSAHFYFSFLNPIIYKSKPNVLFPSTKSLSNFPLAIKGDMIAPKKPIGILMIMTHRVISHNNLWGQLLQKVAIIAKLKNISTSNTNR